MSDSKLDKLRKELQDHPDLKTARQLWEEYGHMGFRTGVYVIECFRSVALVSAEGAVELAKAQVLLNSKTQEKPKPTLFDEELLNALEEHSKATSGHDRVL